jgi:hypothetical protein
MKDETGGQRSEIRDQVGTHCVASDYFQLLFLVGSGLESGKPLQTTANGAPRPSATVNGSREALPLELRD